MPQPLIRLFVSSTFSDFREERRVLQQVVFPQLKRHCESRGGSDGAIRWVDLSRQEVQTLDCRDEALFQGASTPDLTTLALVDRQGHLRLFQPRQIGEAPS